jgi:acyl-ACP thioesterase
MIFTDNVRTSVMDIDEKFLTRPLTFYGWMLASAARHCVPLRLTGPEMIAEGLTWVITHFSVVWSRFPAWNSPVSVVTWPQEVKGFKTRRDYRILTESGETAAVGASNWCLLDVGTRKPVPMDRISDRLVSCHPEEALPGWRSVRLDPPAPGAAIVDEPGHRVSYGDLDFNDHCTNIRYVEWGWGALPTDFQKQHRPVRLDIQFMNEAFSGDVLVVSTEVREHSSLQSLGGPGGSPEYCRLRTDWRMRNPGE